MVSFGAMNALMGARNTGFSNTTLIVAVVIMIASSIGIIIAYRGGVSAKAKKTINIICGLALTGAALTFVGSLIFRIANPRSIGQGTPFGHLMDTGQAAFIAGVTDPAGFVESAPEIAQQTAAQTQSLWHSMFPPSAPASPGYVHSPPMVQPQPQYMPQQLPPGAIMTPNGWMVPLQHM